MRIIILCALLAGCAPAAPEIVDTGCAWALPMTASTADTPATKREILNYEVTRQANCPLK